MSMRSKFKCKCNEETGRERAKYSRPVTPAMERPGISEKICVPGTRSDERLGNVDRGIPL